jgi:hypothetical protein
MTTISKYDNVIDSRDVIARIEDLEAQAEEDEGTLLPEGLDAAEEAELKALQALAEEAEGYATDWLYGETLIRDSYFKEYAQELADDIGAINEEASWPNNWIDWDKAVEELQMDYTTVDFDKVTYWIR